MPAPSPRRRSRRPVLARAGLAVFAALSLATGVHGPAAAATPDTPRDVDTPKAKVDSVPGKDVATKAKAADAGAALDVRSTPKTTWPAAGTAVVAPARTTGDPRITTPTAPAVPLSPKEVALGKAGDLPVWLSAPANLAGSATSGSPAAVKVQSLGHQGNGFVLKLSRSDGVSTVAPTKLKVDYQDFGHAFGGDYGLRLTVYQLPDCASGPNCVARPLVTENNGSGTLSADVPVGARAATFAIAPAAASGAGDFKATALRPSATWTVGGSSGDFNWNYPLQAPPADGGPMPQINVGYSSGGVDGRTTATNNQPSWLGEGFEFTPGGSIERKYASCGSKTEQQGNNGKNPTGDLCWATDNATFSLNGSGGELVHDDATGEWHPRSDDGSTIQRMTGAANGALNGEYWVLTTKDGTKYYFGLNHLPGWDSAPQPTETQSVFTVPVFGNNTGEPCHQTAFASSSCTQAYKWNLDYVVDRNGNTMSLYYDREVNHYARNMTATAVSEYTRAGNVQRIEYGQTDGRAYLDKPVAQVLFGTEARCVPGTACGMADYPDTPLDQECTSTTNCNNHFNPTFWTKKRLTKVTTQVWRAASNAFTDVESWSFRQSFRDPGDGTRAGLWLEAITEAGLVGQAQSMPEVNFDSIQLPNRVDPVGDNQPAMNWLRVSTINYGSGGQVKVDYSDADCKPGDVPTAVDHNTRRCHPMKWTPDGETERTDWFNKYVVTQVTETDRLADTRPTVTKVEYLSAPAWRHDDEDGLVEIGMKTWAQWRGYSLVRVTKGDGTDGPPTVTENRYFQGMDGDQNLDGTHKSVSLTDSNGTKVADLAPLNGQQREQTTLDGSTVVDRTITDQWVSAPTATNQRSWATVQAFQVQQGGNTQVQATANGTRTLAASNTYDANGVLLARSDLHDVTSSTDDTCTRYEYASNAGAGMAELVKRQQTVSVGCDKPFTKDQVIGDTRTFYDGATDINAVPTKGNPTKTDRLSGFDAAGNPTYQVVSTMAYDALGRPVRSTDALGAPTTTSYTPAGTGPLTKTVLTKPNGHTMTTELEPAWGAELAVTDQAGRRTEAEYDAFGRVAKVWLPGRAGTASLAGPVAGKAYTADNAAIPDQEFEYRIGVDNGASSVITRSLQTDGTVEESMELSDGLFRPVQKQAPAPGGGRTLTETWYDSRGLVTKEQGPYWNAEPPNENLFHADQDLIPTQKLMTYDGAGRVTEEAFRSNKTVKWTTKHTNSADQETVEPPAGDSATTKVTDSEGRLLETRQFKGQAATGSFDKTSYSYNSSGLPTQVTDPAGNKWTWEYDIRGRKTKEVDPDKGTTTFTYNDLDQMVTSTDNRGVTLEYSYDLLGRKTAVSQVQPDGTKQKISEWTYDTTPVDGQPGVTAKGSPSSTTRWVNGQPYTTKVLAYDKSGKPLQQQIVIPASEGKLAGTYDYATTYNQDGEVASSTMPAIGGLPAETLQYGYNDQDLPTTLSSDVSTYVTATAYTPYGEVSSIRQQATGGKYVTQDYEYELGTRRMSKVTTKKEVAPERVSQVGYTYDATGNITKIVDAPSSTTGELTDTQCFTYDNLRRLTSAWTPNSGDCAAAPTKDTLGGPSPYWQQWTFDQTGNRKSETRTSSSGTTTSTYNYPAPGSARPHAVQSVVTTGDTGTTTDTYGYDDSGNMTTRTLNGRTETFDWDPTGELTKVTAPDETTDVINNADGDRLLRKDKSGVTLYLYGDTEVLLKPDGTLTGTRYYKHGEQTVAVRVGADQLYWMGADHHGTSTTVIDNTAAQNVQRRRMDPYGNIRGVAPTAWPGQRSFVGGTADPSTGLVHLGAREYDPTTGRFISVDPEADYTDPQTINGYSYANNSPVSFTDPDGNSWFSNIVSSVVNTVKATVQTVVQRTVETVHQVVNVVTPVIDWVKDRATNIWNQITTVVHKAVDVVKKVAKTVVKQVKKLVHAVVKVAKVVTKKIVSAAKTFVKAAVKVGKTVLKKANEARQAAWKGVQAVMHSDITRTILHVAADFGAGVLAGMAAGAVCGPAFLICGAIVGTAISGAAGAGLNTAVAALTGEKITGAKIAEWGLSDMSPAKGALSGLRGVTKTGGLDMLKAAGRGKAGLKELGNNALKIGDPKNWKLPNAGKMPEFLPRK